MDLKGIPVYRFTLQPNTLAAPVDNPDNHCYCTDEKVTKNCTVAGALDVGACKSQSSRWSTHRTACYLSPCLSPKQFFLFLSPQCKKSQRRLHLTAPLPPWQRYSPRKCAGPQPNFGGTHDLPGRGTCNNLQFYVIKFNTTSTTTTTNNNNVHISFLLPIRQPGSL